MTKARPLVVVPPPDRHAPEGVLDRLKPEFLECRDLGHVWQSHNARWFADERVYVQELKCPRCGTVRTRELSETGHIVTGGYHYAEGYTLPPGTGYLTTADRDGIRLRAIAAVLGVQPTRRGRGRKHA